jgi:hypothetical protein
MKRRVVRVDLRVCCYSWYLRRKDGLFTMVLECFLLINLDQATC